MNHPKVKHPRELIKKKPQKKQPSKFSNFMVVKHAEILGSVGFIYFAYALDVLLALVLIQQTYHALTGKITFAVIETLVTLWVVFIAQTYVQFVALPILQNYQNRQSEADQARVIADEAKADVDHEALTHIATISDENRDHIISVVDSLNLNTEGGMEILYTGQEEIRQELKRISDAISQRKTA